MWETRDLWLACFLELRGFAVTDVRVRNEHGRSVGYFQFEHIPDADALSDWINRRGTVEPLAFGLAHSNLKHALHRAIDEQRGNHV